MNTFGLSPAESAFVDALVELGDANEAAVSAGVQPSIGRDPRIQSAVVDRIRECRAVDAAYSRKILCDLARSADQDSVRLRAASTLWERSMGKIPDQVNVDVHVHSMSRETLYAEIRNLIDELGLPPAIEGEFEEIGGTPTPPIQIIEAGVAQPVERAEPPAEPPRRGGSEVAGSSPAAGTYIPELPSKWR